MSTTCRRTRVFTSPVNTDAILAVLDATLPQKASAIRSRLGIAQSKRRVIEAQLEALVRSGVIESRQSYGRYKNPCYLLSPALNPSSLASPITTYPP
jgi:hypothetical protein